MDHATRTLPVVMALVLAGLTPAAPAGEIQLRGRWIGQDQHDYTGDHTAIAPNGVQDIHMVVGGLPPGLQVARGWIFGYGSGGWNINIDKNENAAYMVRKPGATAADLFVDPDRIETGREFEVKLEFDDGTIGKVIIHGGKADPSLRMPGAGMTARWVGQEKTDHAGHGPAVGPDGLQDAHIALLHLAKKDKVDAVLIEGPAGARWASGRNAEGHNNAELLRDDRNPADAQLYFQPDRDLAGARLKITVHYQSGKFDTATVTAGKVDPKLAMPRLPLVYLGSLALESRWLGQDGTAGRAPGDVHVEVSGLPTGRAIAAAVLSDGVRGNWVFRASERVPLDIEPGAQPLAVERGTPRSTASLWFAPCRDESKATMTLRLVYQDGEMAFGTFPGGACDPFLRGPRPDAAEVAAHPGENLTELAARGGTIRLASGVYPLAQPLVLPRPVTIVGEPGAVLQFTQAASDAPWTAAIKIHAGATTLRGFAVRFAGPVRWKTDVSWGSAVIGTTDDVDKLPFTAKSALTFENLDIQGPAASKSSGWEEAVKLMRLKDAPCGRIVGCTLNGGPIEAFEGPWSFENNTYTGTPANTFVHAVFVVHDPHDVVVRNNLARPAAGSGKTWRFLVFTNHGYADRVERNHIAGIGPRDGDTIPSMNAPEIILTESYRLGFEGRPAAVSPDGRMVKVARLVGEAPHTGEVVSVLAGGGVGQYRRIAQRIEPTVYLLEEPLPRGAEVLAIAGGFVGDVYDGNDIDARWGREASGVVLAGSHYGTRVTNNRVTGAGEAFRILAAASEAPYMWGWSHTPYLGGRFDGNTIEDSERGALFAVEHGKHGKLNKGRIYMVIGLKGNTVRWSDEFLKRREASRSKAPLAGLVVGALPSLDPSELVFQTVDDHLDAPPSAPRSTAILVHGAIVNGRPFTKTTFSLPPPATPAVTSSPTGLGGPRAVWPRR